MIRTRKITLAASALLLGLAGGPGCTHNHYYGAAAPGLCDPQVASQPVVIQQPSQPVLIQQPGAVCEVPANSGGSGVTIVPSYPSSPGKISVSQPQGPNTGGSRYAWRKPSPESVATTRVEGGIDESAVR